MKKQLREKWKKKRFDVPGPPQADRGKNVWRQIRKMQKDGGNLDTI